MDACVDNSARTSQTTRPGLHRFDGVANVGRCPRVTSTDVGEDEASRRIWWSHEVALHGQFQRKCEVPLAAPSAGDRQQRMSQQLSVSSKSI